MSKNKTLIIVPAYNEELVLPSLLRDIQESVQDADILVIDDFSSDQTSKVALAEGVLVIRHPFNMGDGAARQTGFKFACQGGYQYVAQIDGDGQHDPSYIPALLEAIQDGTADIVVGSRYLERTAYKTPLTRRVGMLLFGGIASIATRKRLTDVTSGFRAMNRRAVEYFTTEVYPEVYPDADVLIASHRAGLRIKEVPVNMRRSETGKSIHAGFKPVYYVFRMLLSIFVTLLRETPALEDNQACEPALAGTATSTRDEVPAKRV